MSRGRARAVWFALEPFDAIELELSQWWVGSPPKGAAEDGPVWPSATGSP